ncbi:MAG: hypothetical protein KAI25_12175 [Hyphomicrobiaceae bacterium]|nr:hypothetical protein [Hyphomicrobiaceae bacterium]
MPLRIGELELEFEIILKCPTCGYIELPSELVTRENADVRVEEVREGEAVSYCCWGCGRRRYLDEATRTRNLQIKPDDEPEKADA